MFSVAHFPLRHIPSISDEEWREVTIHVEKSVTFIAVLAKYTKAVLFKLN